LAKETDMAGKVSVKHPESKECEDLGAPAFRRPESLLAGAPRDYGFFSPSKGNGFMVIGSRSGNSV